MSDQTDIDDDEMTPEEYLEAMLEQMKTTRMQTEKAVALAEDARKGALATANYAAKLADATDRVKVILSQIEETRHMVGVVASDNSNLAKETLEAVLKAREAVETLSKPRRRLWVPFALLWLLAALWAMQGTFIEAMKSALPTSASKCEELSDRGYTLSPDRKFCAFVLRSPL